MKTMLRVCSAFIAFVLADAPAAFAHWPDQAPHQIAQLGEFKLEGGVLKDLKMSYVTHGQLNAAKDNAILFQHGFALNHHQFDHMIGRGRPLDTDKYFIICPDALGATQTRFEHSSSPTNSGLKMKFPLYNGRDMVKAQYRLITETLGISHLRAVTGISSGADDSVQFAVSYPDFMDGIFPISGGAVSGTQGYFFGPLMISIIESCEGWDGGNYDKNPERCASNALSQLIPYFYTREWWDQYVDTPEAYTKWRNTWGDYYLRSGRTRPVLPNHGIGPGLGRRHPRLQWRLERRAGLDQGEDIVHLQSPRPVFLAAPHRDPGQGNSPCASGRDRFERRPLDLLQRRSQRDMGHGRGDTRIPAGSKCAA